MAKLLLRPVARLVQHPQQRRSLSAPPLSLLRAAATPTLPRLRRLNHHQSSSSPDKDFRYAINYEKLKNAGGVGVSGGVSGGATGDAESSQGFLKTLLPDTVRTNVKNVVGWRGAAERGFLAVYPDLIHILSREGSFQNENIGRWYTKVLTHNLSSSVLGQRFGILVPLAYRQLNKEADRDQMQLAHVLGWGVELVRAANQIAANPEQWANRHKLDSKAFNDAQLLQNGVHILLRHYFSSSPHYSAYLDAYLASVRSSSIGRLMSYRAHPANGNGNGQGSGLAGYDIKTYKELVRHNVSNTCYTLPVSLALHLAGLSESRVHEQAEAIFREIGYFAEVNRDFANCYVDPRGRHIADGKLTWLIVLARQRANAQQRAVLEDCYGCGAEQVERVQQVKQIYAELNLKKIFHTHMEEKQRDILQRIQQISKLDKLGLSPEFFFKMIDSMDNNQIA